MSLSGIGNLHWSRARFFLGYGFMNWQLDLSIQSLTSFQSLQTSNMYFTRFLTDAADVNQLVEKK